MAGAEGKGKKQKPEQKQEKPSSGKPPFGKKEEKVSQRLPDEELALDIPRRQKSEKKLGRTIQLETNHFALSISKNLKVVYQYDVTVEPDRPKKMLPLVMEEFCRKHFPNRFPAYDGMKNLFATALLPLTNNTLTDTINIFMPDNENNKDYKVTVTFNGKKVDMTPLQEYFMASPTRGHRLPPQDVLTVVDVVLRKAPARTFISVGRSFFSPPQGPIIQLGDGMEMYNGFYQSAVLGWKPFLNVDVAHKAFPQRLDGINLLMDLLKCSERDLQGPLRPFDIEVVDKFLRTLKVQYLIPTQPASRRVMRVNAVDQPADKAMFNHDNERMTVKDYFTRIKGYRLRYPHLPCLWVGSKSRSDKILLPIELCTVMEGQAVNRKMTSDQTSAMIKHAATNTEVRKNKIMASVRNANYNQHHVVREFEISVSANMERISGRVLMPPNITYANNRTEKPSRGVWRAQSFFQRCELRSWTILNLDRRTREESLREFSAMMQSEGRRLGMDIAPPAPFLSGLDNRNPLKSIIDHMSNLKQNQIKFVVVVLTDFVPNVYSYVKQAAELQVGLLTQCVKSRNVFRPKNMTVINILLKVNSKLNGINHVLTQKPSCLRRPCMIMGADVTHPSPDAQDTPSVAAVTASHDPTAFKYNICWRLQPPRVEIIDDLENIVSEQLKYFYEQNKQLKPEHIIFFRDGVSEGFFKFVMNREVEAIRKACTRMNQNYKPAITFLVVQKRHHTRLFPLNPRDSEDRNMNVPAGTCVDEWITHPTATDFYLVSHASIQGVAKPTKYRVLWDDLDMTENDLEELTYHLCHMFSRCTRSVSYPAPTYYAHLAAARAKVYIETRRVNVNNLQREQENTQIKDLIVKGTPMFFV
nr:argonaute-2 [Agrilus planipennis]